MPYYKLRYLIAVFVGLIMLSACNKQPESIGLDLVEHNKLDVFDTVFRVSAYSVVEDSVVTDETSVNLLGSMYTANFGLTVASIYSHLRLSELSPDFGDNPQFDSAFLTLVYSGYYGNIATPQTVRIYEVDTSFYKDSTYYSTRRFPYNNIEIGSLTFYPHPEDSIPINDSTKVSAQIKIPLDSAFIVNRILLADINNLISNEIFLDYFKGIYITADSMNSSGEGAILYFNLLNSRSKVTIYYNDTLNYNLVFNQNSARIGSFYHNYAKSLNNNFREQVLFSNTTAGTQNLYLQGLAGIKTVIKIPDLSGWVNTNRYAINEAKLILPVVVESSEELKPADRLLLFKLDANGNVVFTPDQLEGDNYFGGTLSDSANLYQFRISFYVQDLLSGNTDFGLVTLISGKTINANEVMLYGTESGGPDMPSMQLRIVYVKLD